MRKPRQSFGWEESCPESHVSYFQTFKAHKTPIVGFRPRNNVTGGPWSSRLEHVWFPIKMGTHELNLQRLSGSVAHLNELLTMYARLAAATGDPKWEKDYQAIEPQLDNALLGIAVEAKAEYDKNYASKTEPRVYETVGNGIRSLCVGEAGKSEASGRSSFQPGI